MCGRQHATQCPGLAVDSGPALDPRLACSTKRRPKHGAVERAECAKRAERAALGPSMAVADASQFDSEVVFVRVGVRVVTSCKVVTA